VCCRNLALDKRIAFLHDYLLAKIRYVSQIFPTPPDKIRQINTTIAWFIWKGKIFRVPLSTLQRQETEGGWNLVNVEAKCRAFFMYRIQMQGVREGSITADWLNYWNLNTRPGNSPYPNGISEKLDYLRVYAIDAAYSWADDNGIKNNVQ
jgi:hypothetical protein